MTAFDAARHRNAWATLVDGLIGGYIGVPSVHGDRFVFERRALDADHTELEVLEATTQTAWTLDVRPDPERPPGVPRFWRVSPAGSLVLAGSEDRRTGAGRLWVADVATGGLVDAPGSTGCPGSAAWLPDEAGVLYVCRSGPAGETFVPGAENLVRHHRIGAPWADDAVVFAAPEGAHCRVVCCRDGRSAVVTVVEAPEPVVSLHLVPLDGSGSPIMLREPSSDRLVVHPGSDGLLYVATGVDAPGGSLLVIDPDEAAHRRGRQLVPSGPEAIGEIAVCDDAVVVASHGETVSTMAIFDRRTGRHRSRVALPTLGSVKGLRVNEQGGTTVWFHFTPVVPPGTVLELDTATGEVATWAEPERRLPPPPLSVQVDEFEAGDGQRRPIVVVTRAGPAAETPAALLLTPYGEMSPAREFAANGALLAWIASGGAYAVAWLRGVGPSGAVVGRDGESPSHTAMADDLARAAEHLMTTGRAQPGSICLWGRGHGGTAAAWARLNRPDVFGTAIVASPAGSPLPSPMELPRGTRRTPVEALSLDPGVMVTRETGESPVAGRSGSLERSRASVVEAMVFAATRLHVDPGVALAVRQVAAARSEGSMASRAPAISAVSRTDELGSD